MNILHKSLYDHMFSFLTDVTLELICFSNADCSPKIMKQFLNVDANIKGKWCFYPSVQLLESF